MKSLKLLIIALTLASCGDQVCNCDIVTYKDGIETERGPVAYACEPGIVGENTLQGETTLIVIECN